MYITFNKALDILKNDDDEEMAWEIAQQDEGLNPGVTKEQWLEFAYKTLHEREEWEEMHEMERRYGL